MTSRWTERAPRLAAVAATVAAALWVYRAALHAYFFDDDFEWLVGTWRFSSGTLVNIDEFTHFYRPVIDLYFAAATPLFSGSPLLFHAASIALHLVNGLLLFAIAAAISGRFLFALSAMLFFLVQPADVDAVAWVGALAEPLSACFGATAILALIRFRDGGRRAWYALSVVAFALGLLTHESAVMFVPLLVLADRMFRPQAGSGLAAWKEQLRAHLPYVLLLGAYLLIDLRINSRNYVVTDGYYGVGAHVLTNAFEYITALYVGRRDALNYAAVAIAIPLLLLRGDARVRFATVWLLLALLPFLFFTWGTASRYLYLPAIGFSMLLASAMLAVDVRLATRLSPRWRAAVLTVLVSAVAARFMVFAAGNVSSFSEQTDAYRRYAVRFRETYGELPSHSRVRPDARMQIDREHRFVNFLIQWEYRDPTIEVLPAAP